MQALCLSPSHCRPMPSLKVTRRKAFLPARSAPSRRSPASSSHLKTSHPRSSLRSVSSSTKRKLKKMPLPNLTRKKPHLRRRRRLQRSHLKPKSFLRPLRRLLRMPTSQKSNLVRSLKRMPMLRRYPSQLRPLQPRQSQLQRLLRLSQSSLLPK